MKPDFSGYATKAGLKCSDGRTIMPEAFKHMDGMRVPLVWQHGHDKPDNVLGHAVLEARSDGVYAYGFFNGTPEGQKAKQLVEHKDINSLSIYANQLIERGKQVFHGVIRELSLVLSGANPGALIDFVAVQHGDGEITHLEDEAIIYTGLELEHQDMPAGAGTQTGADDTNKTGKDDIKDLVNRIQHADDKTAQDIYDSLTDEQKQLVHYMLGAATDLATASASHADPNGEGNLQHKEGQEKMTRNVFEQKNGENGGNGGAGGGEHTLSHDAVREIVGIAQRVGSLKHAMEEYAIKHGIENIDVLFPQAKNIDSTPEFESRRMEWVKGVLDATRKSPFSRIRTRSADITVEEARAKGYVKGSLKKEEFFALKARITTPTTVYKKQKLDRDDIIDITDFDIVIWLKGEMRLMLEEELARAVLIGDGRAVDDEDKIKDPMGAPEGAGVRSIIHDHELYVTHVNIEIAANNSNWGDVVEEVLLNRVYYKGTGQPTFYTTNQVATRMLLAKDGFGRRLYKDKGELASALNVADIVEVEVMDTEPDLLGIIVNLSDYVVGTDRGGEINLFDFFDIDYNQYKYLIETRMSGALVKIKAALVLHRQAATDVRIVPTAPAFDGTTVTIPTDANVDYAVDGTPATDGDVVPLSVGQTVTVTATAAAGYFFENDRQNRWTFTHEA